MASWCRECEKKASYEYYHSHRAHCLEVAKDWVKKNPEKVKEIARRKNLKIQMAALEAYGGKNLKCACCGEREIKFFGIDHVNGGGNKHRKELRSRGAAMYHELKRLGYPKGFQVLCHNCNLAKGFYGKCPHKNNE